MSKILLIQPPFIQPNCPYPATAYLVGFLKRSGVEACQFDLSVELLNRIFSSSFLSGVFKEKPASDDPNIQRMWILRQKYIHTIDSVMRFLRGNDPAMCHLICSGSYLPQASCFAEADENIAAFGEMGVLDCAKYLSTLYLEDLTNYFREVISPDFGLIKYAEKLAASLPEFTPIATELNRPANRIEEAMIELLNEALHGGEYSHVGFTVPFPGNLLAALRCCKHIKKHHPSLQTLIGGGYPSTELRELSDPQIFDSVDYIIMDDGEKSLLSILNGTKEPAGAIYLKNGTPFFDQSIGTISHTERGCPDFQELPHNKYFSLCDTTNPMLRLWSDGRWNKLFLAHGCYWGKCAFCDTSLDYICRYDPAPATQLVDWMEEIITTTGSSAFHFVDEAAPPKLLKEIALEIIKRRLQVSWWSNIRFEATYTADLCQLLVASGCIAVSGGVEVASNRLLELIHKGITVEQAVMSMRNFYYAGILCHTYLMYGFPTETLQETADSLEVVRQMFQAELITSAYWHRYAMTVHSPSGRDPEKFGVKPSSGKHNPFANNEIPFNYQFNYNLDTVADALSDATYSYMHGVELKKGVHKWFNAQVPRTTVEPTLIIDQLIKPDQSRIFNEHARLVWIGQPIEKTDEGVMLTSNSSGKLLKLKTVDRDFLFNIINKISDLNSTTTLGEASEYYGEFNAEPFSYLYHSKRWDILREYGLLQI